MIPRFDFQYSINDFVFEFKHEKKKLNPDLSPFHDYFGTIPVNFISEARVGICMVLRILGLKPRSAIGVQPFTCSSVLSAIKSAGFAIVFIDIDDNFKLSQEDLLKKRHLIDALIVTHTFGFPENVDIIRQIAGSKPIIEDCAQAFLSDYNGKPVGLSGAAGVFSMGYGKLSGIGSGGFIISKEQIIKAKILEETEKLHYPSKISIYKEHIKSLVLGTLYHSNIYTFFTYPLKYSVKKNGGLQKYPQTELLLPLSRVLLSSKRFRDNLRMIKRQRENGRLLLKLISMRFHPISLPDGSDPNFFLVPLLSKNRDNIIDYLALKGIEAGKHFSNSIHWVRNYGYIEGSCPQFERIACEIFTLPCHYFLSEKQIQFIAESLNNYHEG